VAEWKRVVASMAERDREWLEWQAYSFAGLVLVPREPLAAELEEAVQVATEQGFDLRGNHEVAKDYVCTWLGRRFEVSAQVIEKRLDRDALWPPEPT
jgi:Zn-dependent peptidase ImmA (M78 family)